MFSRIDPSRSQQIGGISTDKPNLGGQDVKAGTTVPKRETTSLGQSFLNFVKSIPAKISTFFEGIAAKREENAKQASATSIGKSLKSITNEVLSGNITKRTLDNLASMEKHAAKIDNNNPKAVLSEMMTTAFASLPTGDLKKLASTNFSALGDQLSDLVDRRFDKYDDLDNALADSLPSYKRKGNDDVTAPNPRELAKSDLKDRLGALHDAVGEARFDKFEATAKGIFKVDDQGFISGGGVNRLIHTPEGAKTAPDVLAGICDGISRRSQEGEGHRVGTARISDKAKADFPRMNIMFDRPQGGPLLTRITDDNNPTPDEIGNAIHGITGNNDKASVVLTSMLTQNGWTNLITDHVGDDGSYVPVLPVAKNYVHSINTPGQTIILDNPGQISEAKFFVSQTDDGDFKIEVNWLASSSSIGLDREPIAPDTPTRANITEEVKSTNTFAVKMTATVILSKTEADLGNLSFVTPPRIEHEFMGRFIATL